MGSLRLVLRAGADAERAVAEVRALFADVLHHLALLCHDLHARVWR